MPTRWALMGHLLERVNTTNGDWSAGPKPNATEEDPDSPSNGWRGFLGSGLDLLLTLWALYPDGVGSIVDHPGRHNHGHIAARWLLLDRGWGSTVATHAVSLLWWGRISPLLGWSNKTLLGRGCSITIRIGRGCRLLFHLLSMKYTQFTWLEWTFYPVSNDCSFINVLSVLKLYSTPLNQGCFLPDLWASAIKYLSEIFS